MCFVGLEQILRHFRARGDAHCPDLGLEEVLKQLDVVLEADSLLLLVQFEIDLLNESAIYGLELLQLGQFA